MGAKMWELPIAMSDEIIKATTVDDRRRIVMPPDCRPNSTVSIQQLDDSTWLVRTLKPKKNFKLVLIPVIDKLTDDPEWQKVESRLARYAASKLPPPDFDE